MKVELFEGRVIKPLDKALSLTGTFDLKKWENKTSDPQRKYYWGVLVKQVSDYTGYTKEETHGKFGWLSRREESKGTPRIKSITELNTKEMEEKNEFLRMYFAEKLGMNIPLPNEIDYNLIEEP